MSRAGTYDGLQFRIMETLEKQPNQAPLTALEIADILHADEYRDELKDNVVFKVSRAVHGMREQGKIVLSEARDKEGRLCYQLPTRVKFPPKVSDKPANPVLTPETAAKITPAAPKERADVIDDKPTRVFYVSGIQKKVFDLINTAPHPLTSKDITDRLGHLYGDNISPERLTSVFSGHLYHLSQVKRTINRRKVKGYGQGIQFEFFTRRTGSEPHPLSLKGKAPEPKAAPERAPLPSQAWAEPVVTRPQPEKVVVEARVPAKPAANGLFRPVSIKQRTEVISARVPLSKYQRIELMAQKFDVTIAEFIVQAVDYALEHAEAE
jgi:hypothetical protein